jgi:O-6-methylguanine DNA methyltransferase
MMNAKTRIILRGPGTRPALLEHAPPDIRWGEAPCPFGTCRIADCNAGICHLSFVDDPAGDAVAEEIHHNWPEARVTIDHAHARQLVAKMFFPQAAAELIRPLLVVGTAFQIAVWQALLEIPAGGTIGYGELAAQLGKPGAARATGTAVGANPIAWLIPSHRVLPAAGGTGGYRWGSARKAAMLSWEGRSNKIIE